VRGTGEGLFGLAVAGEVSHWSAHRRLRMINPQGSGSSACISMTPEPELVDAAARMMRDIRWDGLFMLEFLRDRAGTAWFVELNGRSWGSLALARRLGFEYPAWAVLATLGTPPPTAAIAPSPQPVVCRHLGREIVHLANVVRGPRSAALDEWPSRWGTVRAVARVRRNERWYNWSARHPAVFVDDTVQTVLAPFRRRASR
jgi:predicted ATP-grasp superfamily ATP-dependent carboligase